MSEFQTAQAAELNQVSLAELEAVEGGLYLEGTDVEGPQTMQEFYLWIVRRANGECC